MSKPVELKYGQLTACIVTGNPRFVDNNPLAIKYYQDIKEFLLANGCKTVLTDPGLEMTRPPNADLYIGHSRGCGRRHFMSEDKQAVFLLFGNHAGISHPADVAWMKKYGHLSGKPNSPEPPPEHFIFIDAQKRAILDLVKKITGPKQTPATQLLLYHYSTESRKVLLTRAVSTRHSPAEKLLAVKLAKEQGRVGPYYDHISFFFEPIPRDLGSLYAKHHHPVWRKGQVLYEHVVDITPVEFAFEVVETPSSGKFIDEHWRDEFLEDDKEELYIDFSRRKMKQMELEGNVVREMGYNAEPLRKASQHYVGQIRDYYVETLRTSNLVNLGRQYATAVPHVMLYPEGGKIDSIVQVNKIVLS